MKSKRRKLYEKNRNVWRHNFPKQLTKMRVTPDEWKKTESRIAKRKKRIKALISRARAKLREKVAEQKKHDNEFVPMPTSTKTDN